MGSNNGSKRLSPAVYRRRRLVLLLAVVLVIGLIWLLIAQPWNSAATQPEPKSAASQSQSAPAPTPSASETGFIPVDENSTPSPSAETVEGPACVENVIQVTAVTSKERYASDEEPGFSIKLHNSGNLDCKINVGTKAQNFTVMQGEDVVWSSKDCQSEANDEVVLIKAGQTVQSATPLLWNKTRSNPEQCGENDKREEAAASGTTYNLLVSIGGVSSRNNAFFELF